MEIGLLRWSLLLAGVVILAFIYFLGSQSRKKRQVVAPHGPTEQADAFPIKVFKAVPDLEPDDEDYRRELDALGQVLRSGEYAKYNIDVEDNASSLLSEEDMSELDQLRETGIDAIAPDTQQEQILDKSTVSPETHSRLSERRFFD